MSQLSCHKLGGQLVPMDYIGWISFDAAMHHTWHEATVHHRTAGAIASYISEHIVNQ